MRRITLVIAMLLLGASAASSQSRDRLAIQDFLDYEQVRDFFRGGGPYISPDGKQVLYTRWWVDKMNDRWKSSQITSNPPGRISRRHCAKKRAGS